MASPPRSSRARRPVKLSEALQGCIAPALRRQGFGEAEIVTDWPQIVGARLAAASAPTRLIWPPTPPRPVAGASVGAERPATLCVRVEGAFALELQHLAPVVIERVNARLGWRCVERLHLLQGPAPRPKTAAPRPPAPTPEEAARAAQAAQGVDDDALRSALTRLGSRIFAQGRGAPRKGDDG